MEWRAASAFLRWGESTWRRLVRVSRRSDQDRAERHEGIQDRGLAGGSGLGEEVRLRAGVEVEEVGADGDAEMLLVFDFEGSVRQVGEWEVGGGIVGFGEPASVGRRSVRLAMEA